MCLVALALDQSRRFPLVVASNRDEFHERPTARLAWWAPEAGAPEILSGRDLQAGGTWLGLNAAGRLALVTNVRRGDVPQDPKAPSRGAIVARWLRGDLSLDRFWTEVALSGYNGFNLIAADFAHGDCFWASSEATLPRRLDRGLYGLSNAALDTPWPKVQALKARVGEAVVALPAGARAEDLATRLFEALSDRQPAADASLPSTGVPREVERMLSASFIASPDGRYGTRCSTVVITERLGRHRITHVFERSFSPHSSVALMRHARLADWPPKYSALPAEGAGAWRRPEVVEASDGGGPAASASTPPALPKPRARGVIKPPARRLRAAKRA
ncbi:MAG TPA: NRDE family protein [Methylibium sp.]|uniref:NRDE family protein n=1 Tax=Methylibium sp. TaxID=2067992 RepID=UPI002DBE698E|nr:NRDE family protein [Methylibium sp.]HEU4460612.1 NRDE family protein [Methylibium sp.]